MTYFGMAMRRTCQVIRAVIFDLDGTLVRTEHLKALSYARALDMLDPTTEHERQTAEAFHDVIGMSREAVADHLLACMGLEHVAARRARELGLAEPRDVLLRERLRIYQEMMLEPGLLRRYRTRCNVDFLFASRAQGYPVALATGATCETAAKVLASIDLTDCFDEIVSGYEVPRNKPAPDIYVLAAKRLGVRPEECIAIEDSRVGVESAVTAGTRCVAVTTAYTRRGVHDSGLLDPEWIVDDSAELEAVSKRALEEG
jgi:beta-phosphoglucomutase